MISSESVPRIDGDMAALTAHADSLTHTGVAIAEIGARIHQNWQSLGAVYVAPEADQLLAATGPVMTVSASAGEDIGTAAQALRSYAADTAQIQARLEQLRGEVAELVAAYGAAQDESTTVTLDDHAAAISTAVATQIEAWETVQFRCASALRALTGATSPSTTATVVPLGSILGTPPAPTGPMRRTFPLDPGQPVTTTGHPPLVSAPSSSSPSRRHQAPASSTGPAARYPPLARESSSIGQPRIRTISTRTSRGPASRGRRSLSSFAGTPGTTIPENRIDRRSRRSRRHWILAIASRCTPWTERPETRHSTTTRESG